MNISNDVDAVFRLVAADYSVEAAAKIVADARHMGSDYVDKLVDGYYEELADS